MKKHIGIILAVCMFMGVALFPGAASAFSDVPKTHERYAEITALADEGILSGYEDGTFRPQGEITRAEAAAVIVRAAGLPLSDKNSCYADMDNAHWARGYVMAATEAGILSGMGNGNFQPEGKVTQWQIVKMVVCMAGLEAQANEAGGWPNGYVKVAADKKMIDYETEWYLGIPVQGNKPATRQTVALFVYNALDFVKENAIYKEGETLCIGNAEYKIGMSADELPVPEEKLESYRSFTWYVYGTDNYKKFWVAGVCDGRVIALGAAGKGFRYLGYESGAVLPEEKRISSVYTDEYDNNRMHAVLIWDEGFKNKAKAEYTQARMDNEAKMNFHCTNAFRVMHGERKLTWSRQAAKSAYLHSRDMADNDYFDHTGLNGSNSGVRMQQQGINWMRCGENIALGYDYGFSVHNAWVNSAGHRRNLLGNYTHFGAGAAQAASGMGGVYFTQNFYSEK